MLQVQLMQKLMPANHQQRHVFADWVREMHKNVKECHELRYQELNDQ